jgi:hypothetical protein
LCWSSAIPPCDSSASVFRDRPNNSVLRVRRLSFPPGQARSLPNNRD